MMAEAMTYSQLLTDVAAYAEREDEPFISQVPRFVMLAENRIASEVHGLGFLKVANMTFVTGTEVVKKPARWRETLWISVTVNNERIFLKQRSYGYCRAYWSNSALTDVPSVYGDYDYEHLIIAPTPASGYSGEIAYHERPVPLDDSTQTNWTTRYAPQLLLYATLLEAQTWLKLPERIPEFNELYAKAAAGVSMEAQRRLMGDQSLARSEG